MSQEELNKLPGATPNQCRIDWFTSGEGANAELKAVVFTRI
jgi:hypothetical protein